MKAPFWQVTGAKRCGRRGAVCARSACRRAQSRPLWRLSGAGGGARARRELAAGEALLRASPSPRTKWTRRVPRPVLIGHVAS
jgi:hypothetical protein